MDVVEQTDLKLSKLHFHSTVRALIYSKDPAAASSLYSCIYIKGASEGGIC